MDGPIKSEHWHDAQRNPAGGVTQGVGFTISWQNGPLGKPGSPERRPPNGAFVEDVIKAAADRLNFYQAGRFGCAENEEALMHLDAALGALRKRTERRTTAGVEGTHKETSGDVPPAPTIDPVTEQLKSSVDVLLKENTELRDNMRSMQQAHQQLVGAYEALVAEHQRLQEQTAAKDGTLRPIEPEAAATS